MAANTPDRNKTCRAPGSTAYASVAFKSVLWFTATSHRPVHGAHAAAGAENHCKFWVGQASSGAQTRRRVV